MKILVTGAAGFIGSHTAERLKKLGHDVIGIDNFSSYYSLELKKLNEKELKSKGVPVLNKDLRDTDLAEALPKDINYIFHFAAQPGISKTSTFEDYFSNNILATKNLIDYAQSLTDLKLFVNIGTSSIYGLEATFPEDVAPKPASHYGVTKLTAEQLVLQKSREKQFKACSLRLYSVIGPRERPEKMYTKLIACAFNDSAFPLFDGSASHLRSFTYVGDIVDGVVSVINNEGKLDGEIINLGTEVEHTTQEGIEAVEAVIGKSIKINHVEARAGDQLRTKANIDKARKLLNYNPKTTLLEGVRYQVNWYKENFM
ncbi:NAD(P)-dependent oxidoreductase [Oceanihabitans sediminis]|uniref:NAD-dependent epimerase/dehydratase family protein n=1 Tax=Oceanihabitans sediminis TaxID=1812012 RepID=A0A368P2S7_9FLAO|nr:NAD-dependent epimerase/dehydratase family protein [Oceanihabitans sediminis]MDX1278131.1 NAD-dependent epimerase/dehydratase family protein [Oceanihabitans sediminis]MDX1774406.1 NAD-dependent epimerase/dehydratase family protein [Oceanihabitans sediminis]RBP29791.1 nucleoside-diphosphate-sugar epimerase [Oceanihabitans sediminis]RCU57132.1 NAD-dependent epimerase/dehydratase family protein [Oceanihabitans sediminis]